MFMNMPVVFIMGAEDPLHKGDLWVSLAKTGISADIFGIQC